MTVACEFSGSRLVDHNISSGKGLIFIVEMSPGKNSHETVARDTVIIHFSPSTPPISIPSDKKDTAEAQERFFNVTRVCTIARGYLEAKDQGYPKRTPKTICKNEGKEEKRKKTSFSIQL